MRILWLSHLLPYPPHGGVLQRSYNLLRHIAARHEVHLVALNQRALLSTPDRVEWASEELSKVAARVDVFPMQSDRSRLLWAAMAGVTFFHSSPYDINWLRSPSLRAYLTQLGKSERFDLVHLDTVGLVPYATCFAGTPVVLNHHNIESHMMARRAENEPVRWRRLYFRREARKLAALERDVVPWMAMNLVVSELDAARLLEVVGQAPIRVVHNGVDIDYFAPVEPPMTNDGGLVFAGGMNWYPNREAVLYLLREIWPELISDRADRHITILGQDPPAELVAAAVDPRISVPGFVPDVRPYIDAASVYICPILDGGGTRLKILDALAMAKPLVATGLAVEGLGLEDGVHYLKAETPADYVRQVRRLETEPALARRLANRGRELVEQRYAWSVIGERLEDAYRSSISQMAPAH